MIHQFHYGKKFYQDKKIGYWISTTEPRVRAHVWVWIQNHGEIEKGMHVHHHDEDKSNNEIENLVLLSSKEHLSLHMTVEKRRRASDHANKIRHLTKKWHASPEGIEWHRNHGISTWEQRQPISKTCKYCSKEFFTKIFHQDHCSNKCKSAERRRSGIDDIYVSCLVCGNKYKRSKYARAKTCGRACGGIFKSKEYKARRA